MVLAMMPSGLPRASATTSDVHPTIIVVINIYEIFNEGHSVAGGIAYWYYYTQLW